MEDIRRTRWSASRVTWSRSITDTDPERAFRVTDAFSAVHRGDAGDQGARAASYESSTSRSASTTPLTEAEQAGTTARATPTRSRAAPPTSTRITRCAAGRAGAEELLEHESRQAAIGPSPGTIAVTAVDPREPLQHPADRARAELDRLLLAHRAPPRRGQVRHQIEDVQRRWPPRQQRRLQDGGDQSEDAQLNPLHNELRSQLAQASEAARSVRARAWPVLLDQELDRSRRIATSERAVTDPRLRGQPRDLPGPAAQARERARVDGLTRNRGLTCACRTRPPCRCAGGLRFMHTAAGRLAIGHRSGCCSCWSLRPAGPLARQIGSAQATRC